MCFRTDILKCSVRGLYKVTYTPHNVFDVWNNDAFNFNTTLELAQNFALMYRYAFLCNMPPRPTTNKDDVTRHKGLLTCIPVEAKRWSFVDEIYRNKNRVTGKTFENITPSWFQTTWNDRKRWYVLHGEHVHSNRFFHIKKINMYFIVWGFETAICSPHLHFQIIDSIAVVAVQYCIAFCDEMTVHTSEDATSRRRARICQTRGWTSKCRFFNLQQI